MNFIRQFQSYLKPFFRRSSAPSSKPVEPSDIQIIGRELAIRWSNNQESYFPLEELRRACPCAACAGEQDLTGPMHKPVVSYNDKSFTLAGLDKVGGYALQPRWEDGHSTGLYSWSYLQTLTGQQHPAS